MSASYEYCIVNCYSNSERWYPSSARVLPESSNLNSENLNCLSIKINFAEEQCDIPCFCLSHITGLSGNIQLSNSILYYPITYCPEHPTLGRVPSKKAFSTAAPVIKAFFIDVSTNNGLFKINIGENYYYGGRGLILNKDNKPLIMLSLKVQKRVTDNNVAYIPLYPILRISPLVYREDGPLEKHIKSKLLPEAMLMNRRMFENFNTYIPFCSDNVNMDFKVFIEDFSNMFVTPSIPNINITEEDINTFLKDNVDAIAFSDLEL